MVSHPAPFWIAPSDSTSPVNRASCDIDPTTAQAQELLPIEMPIVPGRLLHEWRYGAISSFSSLTDRHFKAQAVGLLSVGGLLAP